MGKAKEILDSINEGKIDYKKIEKELAKIQDNIHSKAFVPLANGGEPKLADQLSGIIKTMTGIKAELRVR